MNILEKITKHTRELVDHRKQMLPIAIWESSKHFSRPIFSLKNKLQKNQFGIIAEFKKQSPSKGVINKNADLATIISKYVEAGAIGCSVLTNEEFFGGCNADLVQARDTVAEPLLRKDFIIDEYQLYEAKAIGADVVLLIAECLSKKELLDLAKKAKELGLETLMEIHSEKQLDKANEYVDIIGVNNRDLETFTVDIHTSLDLVKKIPDDFAKISESGISNARTVVRLMEAGFQGFLIGEHFMKTDHPGESCKLFIEEVQSLVPAGFSGSM